MGEGLKRAFAAAKATRVKEDCPIDNCSRGRQPHQMMCWPHWQRVPRALNKAIFDTFANGPRDAYLANRAEAIRVVNEKEAADAVA